MFEVYRRVVEAVEVIVGQKWIIHNDETMQKFMMVKRGIEMKYFVMKEHQLRNQIMESRNWTK